MAQTGHKEQHFMASDTVRDIVIGMSDGLTVPFAIAAGMSGASVAAKIVITAGLAEIVAGSISMGLGGYLAGRTDVEHYEAEERREIRETEVVPDLEIAEVQSILQDFGLDAEQSASVVGALSKNQSKWVDFMMRFELGLERPNPRRALQSAITIALSYAISGFIPLSPYIFVHTVKSALYVSVVATLLALFLFGFIKGRVTGLNAFRSGWQTMLIGGVAAGTAFGVARLI